MNVILFFTYGVSLKDWDNSGLISREIKLYKELSEKITGGQVLKGMLLNGLELLSSPLYLRS